MSKEEVVEMKAYYILEKLKEIYYKYLCDAAR